MTATPASLGYRMPGEWENLHAVWLAWPHNRADWPGKFDPIPWVYADMIRILTSRVKVRLLVKNPAQEQKARVALDLAGVDLSKIIFHTVPTNRIWMRDSGPSFVVNKKGEKAMVNWRFNAWAKYPDHKLDDKIGERVNTKLHLPRFTPHHKGRRVVLEGGSIDVNGKGTLLTTLECLQSPDVQIRNPGFTRADYEQIFADNLGVTNTIWLDHGIVGDDTHGHVDDLARFVDANTVVIARESNKQDDNYDLLQKNIKILKKSVNEKGAPLNVVELPMPRPVVFEGQRLPASYANFLIANGLVLVPTFNDPNDRVALNILAEAMPKHEIIGIHSTDFVWGLGTIHCASQQEPA